MHKFKTQIQSLMDGHCKALLLRCNGNLISFDDDETYDNYTFSSNHIMPTAANPLHKGHLHMANHVKSIRDMDGDYEGSVEFELSIANVDKDNLSAEEVCIRLKQFMRLGRKCWITTFATFAQKAHFFRDCTFVIGTDTANRIVDPTYYFDCEEERDKVMDDISIQNCSFMVLDRSDYTLDPYCLKMSHLFFIEEHDGHDISSTEIRDLLR